MTDPAKRPPKRPPKPGFFDFSHPFYRPLWVRLVVVGTALGWALFEAVQGSPGWAILFGAVGAVALRGLFLTYDPGAPDPAPDPTPDPAPDGEDRR